MNQPQVRREGGRGMRSRFDQALISSWRDSSDLRVRASLILRAVLFAMITAIDEKLQNFRVCVNVCTVRKCFVSSPWKGVY